MKLGSLKEGGRDGTLIVVSRDLARGVRATGIAPTLQRALEDWSNTAPRLNALYESLNAGDADGAFDLDMQALAALKRSCNVELSTDSVYVRDGITKWIHGWRKNGWRTADKKPVKNAELWQVLVEACAPHTIDWRWVKGHNGDPDNERVDVLARNAAVRFRHGAVA